jgi:superfamily II DNA/RNA helicase
MGATEGEEKNQKTQGKTLLFLLPILHLFEVLKL